MKISNFFKQRYPLFLVLLFCLLVFSFQQKEEDKRPNILFIVADDMNFDSPGFAGGVAPNVTPNIDKLAAQSFLFTQAFTTVAVCQPSRQSILSGMFPQNNGGRGFFPMKNGVKTLPLLLKNSGYQTGIIHKVSHHLPKKSFKWDFTNRSLGLLAPENIVGRDPKAMAKGLTNFITEADKNGKPFFMLMNSADPHRPFHDKNLSKRFSTPNKKVVVPNPSRIYSADEVNIPPSLPDLPGVRKDLAKYASSVRRLDDAVGEALKVLKKMNKEESTIIVFISDNGIPLPYGKFDCYLGSNKSPILFKYPKLRAKPGVDTKHLTYLMDLTPTLLELANVKIPKNLDGKSLVKIIKGKKPKKWRKSVVFQRNEDIFYGEVVNRAEKNRPGFIENLQKSGWVLRPDHPQKGTHTRDKETRAIFDGKYGYIFNQWYKKNGLELGKLGAGFAYNDPSLVAMRNVARNNKDIQKQYEKFIVRDIEELYDWSIDPGSKNNLAKDPKYAVIKTKLKEQLVLWMKSVNDPIKDAYLETVN